MNRFVSSLRSHHSLYEPLLSFAYATWQHPDRGYFDSVSTQLELSVVSLFSGGREKEHLPNKVDKSYRIVCDQFGTPTEAYDEEGKETLRRLII